MPHQSPPTDQISEELHLLAAPTFEPRLQVSMCVCVGGEKGVMFADRCGITAASTLLSVPLFSTSSLHAFTHTHTLTLLSLTAGLRLYLLDLEEVL